MKLADLSTQIRLRSPWEAVDLGFAMVQQHGRGIFPTWLLLLSATSLMVWLALPTEYRHWAPMVIWWLKPLYDRVLLHLLSHQLFGQQLSGAETVSALPSLIRNTGLLGALTFRRFSLSRGFNLPIWQLEQLRGKPRAERQELLHLQAHSNAVWLTIGCIHLESVLIISLYALILIIAPANDSKGVWSYLSAAFVDPLDTGVQFWGNIIYTATYSLSVALMEPFYVAASFSLYLNRRTQLEAWDIEITFRRLGERLRQAGSRALNVSCAALLVASVLSTFHQPAYAAELPPHDYLAAERLPAADSRAKIDEVMKLDEFSKVHTLKQWQPRKKDKQAEPPKVELQPALQALFARFFKAVLWLVLVVLVVLALVFRRKLWAMLKPPARKLAAPPPPDILFGLDIRPESLPADIAAASQQLWATGQQRAALSLLYRGALMRLTRHDQLPISDSATEGEILQLARQHLGGQRIAWLTAVTQAWQELAYAHRVPAAARVEPLFDGWTQHFGAGE